MEHFVTNRVIVRASIGITLVIFVLLSTGRPDIEETVPSLLRGTWIAEDGLYEGRMMEIDREQITFAAGTGQAQTYPVLGVFVERLDEETRFALDYVMETGGEYRLHLVYAPATRQLRMSGRRQVVWNRRST